MLINSRNTFFPKIYNIHLNKIRLVFLSNKIISL